MAASAVKMTVAVIREALSRDEIEDAMFVQVFKAIDSSFQGPKGGKKSLFALLCDNANAIDDTTIPVAKATI